jgi:TolB-like protein/tetratricopeptide (TPR) repeat protein
MLTIRPKKHRPCPGDLHASEELVRAELARILESDDFKATPRRKKLLQYLVEQLLSGRERELKGYTIATVVFDRDDNFDPQTDPVVRLEARRLRHDLDGYYVSAGRDDPLRISIPKGQYVPRIERTDVEAAILPDGSSPERGRDQGKGIGIPRRIGTSKLAPYVTHGAVAAITLLIVAIAYLYFLPATVSRESEAATNGTALAVMPFEAVGTDPLIGSLARGMADEVMNGINQFGVFRLYMATDSDATASVPSQADALPKLSYVVSGSIDADTDADVGTIRVNTRLIEVQTQRIVWMGSYDRNYSVGSIRSVQREIAASIASALGQPYGVVRTAASITAEAETAAQMSSYACVLRAYAYRRSFKREEHDGVLPCLTQAVSRDPNYAEAWAMLAWLQMDEGRFGWTADGSQDKAYQQALATARHSLELDHDNVSALKTLASTMHYMGDYTESERTQRQALAINPNDPDTLAQLGWRLAVRGKFDEGIPFLERAIQRSVNPPGWYYHLIAIDQYEHGRFDEMLATAKKSTVDGSGISWSLVAIAQGALGQFEEARKSLADMAAISPLLGRDPAQAYRRHQAVDSIVDSLVSGLRKAGWGEPATAKQSG